LKKNDQNADEPKYVVNLSPDFQMDADWIDAIKKKLNVSLIKPGKAPDAQIEMALVDDSVNRELDRYKNLKTIFSLSAGIENLPDEQYLRDIPIVRLVTSEMIALMQEYVCYFVLKLHRNFFSLENNQKRKIWEWLPPQKAANSCRVTVLGLGKIGLPVAKSLAGLGFNVAGWSRTQKKVNDFETHCGAEGLAILLPATNILVNMLPLTPETKGLLNASLFQKLLSEASVINVGRGGCLIESDLIEALDSGQLSHAVLDVFQREPLPKSSALWKHPQITVTPHMAAYPESSTYYSAIEAAITDALDEQCLHIRANTKIGY
jgi:glyoxylate/hydroxypyruvate reductase A